MEGDGVKLMVLFARWCDSEFVSNFRSKIDKWAALLRSEESIYVPKSVSTNPFWNLVYSAPTSYGFTAVWTNWRHNMWLNVYIYLLYRSHQTLVVQSYIT